MNPVKARDFFSDYYEGLLEPGLKQAFERALKSDPNVEQEYRQFEIVMSQLGSIDNEPVESPFNLYDKITARLDLADLEAKNKNRSKTVFSWRSLAYGGVAVLALVGAVVSLTNRDSLFGSGFVPSTQMTRTAPKMVVKDGALHLRYRSETSTKVTIRQDIDGPIIEEQQVIPSSPLDKPLHNSSPLSTFISIQFGDGATRILVAMPGTERTPMQAGTGTVRSFSLALATAFGKPVEVGTQKLDESIKWTVNGPDAVDITATSAEGKKLSVDERGSGVLFLSE